MAGRPRNIYPDEAPHMDQATAVTIMQHSGLSTSYLANLLGVDKPRIWRWMNFQRKMPRTAILLLERQIQTGHLRVKKAD